MPSTAEIASGFVLWPTPKAGHEYRQHTAGQAEKDGRHGWKLPGAVADSLSPEPVRLWPTPDVPNGGRGIPKDAERRGNSIYTASGRKVQEGLANAVKFWPTPRMEGFDAGAHRGNPDSLHSAVKLLPTPTVQDAKNNAGPSQFNRNSDPLNVVAVKTATRDGLWTTPCADDTGHRSSRYAQGGTALSAQAGGKLHGRWTLALMGFPPDWCDDLPPDPLAGTPT